MDQMVVYMRLVRVFIKSTKLEQVHVSDDKMIPDEDVFNVIGSHHNNLLVDHLICQNLKISTTR